MANSDNSYRTVIISNIPHEVTENRLMDKFSQIGNITNFHIIRDADPIKNVMVAYCEYSHIEMALNAFRNLNGIEMVGQKLRVALIKATDEAEKAASSVIENSKDPNNESGEAITQAVASLPPDQMYELMKQMKVCIQNNPNEARNMLLQNPQLAYALLQAQIVMKIADPKVAIAMLNRSSEQIPHMTQEPSAPKESAISQTQGRTVSAFPSNEFSLPQGRNMTANPSSDQLNAHALGRSIVVYPGNDPSAFQVRGRSINVNTDNVTAQLHGRGTAVYPTTESKGNMIAPGSSFDNHPQDVDPRIESLSKFLTSKNPVSFMPRTNTDVSQGSLIQGPSNNSNYNRVKKESTKEFVDSLEEKDEKEKTALILQVLKLTDQQIAMLPEDQRRSILVLKDQLRKA